MANEELRDRWPSYTWAFDVPGLRDILEDPKITDTNELQARIQETPWWQQTAPSIRNWLARQKLDPAGAEEDRKRKEADIWDVYLSLGLKPDPADVQSLSTQALSNGWTDNQLRDAVVSHMRYSPQMHEQVGTIQTTMQAFKASAGNMYVGLDDETAFNWARSVSAGEHKPEDYQTIINTWAKSRFAYSPEIQHAIDTGVSVKDYFAPYQQEAAKLLETSPESIDFAGTPKWSRVLDTVDDKGQHRVMSISEMQSYVRGMDEWKGTRQGQESAATMAEGLLKMFGEVA